MGLQAKQPAPFNDIANYADQSKDEIGAAYQAGIIKGYEGKFNPGALVMCRNKNKMSPFSYTKRWHFYFERQIFWKRTFNGKKVNNTFTCSINLDIGIFSSKVNNWG
ncbi:S-layer homology domain-containing protein [Lysinibacillus pakistanensis]|uniref:SLH domain-containing protein n=1 Tax=Lysinibacillus pakistanensis TaxID=759811 RepID=A0ABX6DE48_9BACI|nr:hypothetical protein GDS87_14900 [Lysinibacillus pakistanensis]